MMTQLVFCRAHDGRSIARAQVHESLAIPNVGDHAYVADDQQSYVYVQVAGRQFWYDHLGHLSTVRLSCNVLAKQEEPPDAEPRGFQHVGLALRIDHTLSHHDGEAEKPFPFIQCPRCACPISLHQPDPELPDHMLATCEYCKSWYITNPRATGLSLISQRGD